MWLGYGYALICTIYTNVVMGLFGKTGSNTQSPIGKNIII